MDQIQTMRVFVRVVEAGNFTRAGDSLGLPKATVTKQIQSLESRLRVKLLNRTTRRVTVTPDGAAYYERVARLLNDFDELESSMTNSNAAPSGRLRVDVGTATARLIIIPRLQSFCDQYPDIQVDLGVSDRPVDLIGDNVDVVIRAGEIGDQSLVARRIGTLPFVTVASTGYLKKYGTPRTPHDLERGRQHVINFFSHNSRRVYPLEFHKDGEVLEVVGPSRLAVNDSNAYTEAVLAGFGVAQMVRFVAAPYLASGELVELFPDWECPPLPMHVVYPPNRHLSAKVRAFVDWTAAEFARRPDLVRAPAQATAETPAIAGASTLAAFADARPG
ncbi:LysR family transcriptional regulator [Pseudacidovorax intermedius]|uniref:LysR family transcriptional regulator n=1 Tax=Pseudacidovorax intermedius TaxID=433924 RepID=UPI0009EBF05D|nr:LysR family transcriptional regulator [Pseudacidovorax intermedius]